MLEVINSIKSALEQNAGLIGMGLGVLFMVAKAVSNEKAPKAIQVMQKMFDGVSMFAEAIGGLAKKVSELLANLIKSDGFLGKK